MRFEVEVGGRMRTVDARGLDLSLDGRPVQVDAVRAGRRWSLILGPADRRRGGRAIAGPDESGLARPFTSAGAPEPMRSYEVAIAEHATGDLTIHVNGRPVVVRSHAGRGRHRFGGPHAHGSGRPTDAGHEGPQRVVAPMPGRVAKVLVKAGDAVTARQGLVVIEAMKMESELRSPRAGTVTEVTAVEGALVGANTVLVVVE